MTSRPCSAVTLVELLVVLAIIGILTALSMPLWSAVKAKSRETASSNTLRQAWLATELYRADNQGAGWVGSSSQMGLPNRETFALLTQSLGLQWNHPQGKRGYAPIYYAFDASDAIKGVNEEFIEAQLHRWLHYNARFEGKSILIGDFTATTWCGNLPVDTQCRYSGLGINLDGQVRHRTSIGNVAICSWWDL